MADGNFGNVTATGNIVAGGYISAVGNVIAANLLFSSPTTANIDVGNIALYNNLNMTGSISAGGNITGARLIGNLATANQPNITSIGTLSSLTVTGNTTSGNVLTSGIVSSAGNATHSNVTTGIVSANAVLANTITFNSPTTANIDVGNLALYSNLNMTGSISAGGNITGARLIGNLTTANQPNITSVGTLSSLTVSGNATSGNVLTAGIVSSTGNATHGNVTTGTVSANTVLANTITFNSPTTANISAGNLALYSNLNMTGSISAAGNIKGNYFLGNGYYLTGISGVASNYGNSNVAAYLPTYTGNLTANDISATGNITGSYVFGNGSQLTGITSNYGNSNVVANIAALGSNPVSTTGNITANYFIGNGSQLTDLPASYSNADVFTYLANSNVVISTTGNITGSYIFGNGSQLTGISGGNASTGNVTFDDNTVIGTGDEYGGSGLYLAPGANSIGNVQYLRVRGGDFPTHIHLDTGNNQYFDQYFGDDGKYVKLANTGDIVINSDDNNGNSAQWTFGTDGTTVFPNNTILTPINENFNITVQDEEDDGFSIDNTITDGIGNNLSQTRLESGQFSIYTDLPNGGYEWRFERDTLQVTNNSFIRGFDANVTVQSMFSGSNGTASLQSVSNVNDPNVFSTFDATTSDANIKVYNGGSNGGTEYAWQFSNTGNLTLPRGGVVYETNIPSGGLSGNTIALMPSGGTNADQQLLVYPTAGADLNHLHLTSGNLYNTELFLGDDNLYVKLANTGNVVINSNDGLGNSAQWTFTANGTTIIPGGLVGSGASPAPYISGFASASFSGNLSSGNLDVSSTALIGPNTSANFTRFPNATVVISNVTANIQQNESGNIGLISETTANSANTSVRGVGVYGVGYTAGGASADGIDGEGHVSDTNDTGTATGVRGYSYDTHAGGVNIGVYASALNGATNYALYMKHGNIISDDPQTWTLVDNNASALSFNATGKTGILGIVTTNGSEGVTMSGYANVTGNVTGGNISTGGNLSVTGNANITGTLSSTGKMGYASGSTVTQLTSRGTGVSINTLAGTIITTSAAMVANEIDTFSVTNSSVDINSDIVLAQIVSPNQGTYNCIANPATIGGFNPGFFLNIVNISGFTTSDETITIRFMIIKAPNA